MRALALALALALGILAPTAGCSIVHHADPGYRPRDTGPMDGGPDPDAWEPDVGMDGQTDAWMCPHTTEGECGDGLDDDCDGVVDCADSDCLIAHAAECCGMGGTPTVETFSKSGGLWSTSANWVTPADMSGRIVVAGSDGALTDMGTGALVGMTNRACLGVDLGLELRFQMRALPCTDAECDGRMEVVVGPSTSFTGMLTDDLAIRGVAESATSGRLRLEVVQGGQVRARSTQPFEGNDTTIVVNLAPGLASGQPAIVATVIAQAGGVSETLWTQEYVTQRDVYGTSSCHGLRLGIQGTGTHVALDDVSIAQLDCSNPARFDQVRNDADALDAVTLSVSNTAHTAGWGRGGIGDPALVSATVAGSARFMLLFDGSPVDRASDVIGRLPLAIGGADTTTTSGSDVVLPSDCNLWIPRGTSHPACMPLSETTSHYALVEAGTLAMRDPTFYPEQRTGDVTSLRMAWVGEQDGQSGLHLYTTVTNVASSTRVLGLPEATEIQGENETCGSIRNPLLLPLLGSSTDWLLFYVCDAFPPRVHAALLQNDGTRDIATRLPDIELGPSQLGTLAQQGVTDIAGVVFDYPDAPTYRLWMTARPTPRSSVVLFAEGTPPAGSPAGTPPVFHAFPGNPVLTATSTVFGDCGAGCQLRGITATRVVGHRTQVRLLVERWVDTGTGLDYSLVPLEQIWPTDPP
ncbi:MAG: hypothetical protein U0234_09380 [Sandaracinus sp.]